MSIKVKSAYHGINILELTKSKSGAFCGMMMADNGAEVIKISEIDKDHFSSDPVYSILDRGKIVVELDITDGIDKIKSFLENADVFLVDYELPDSTKDVFSYELLKEINPSLILCSITAYGETIDHHNEDAIEDLVKARTGFCSSMPGFFEGDTHIAHPIAYTGAGLLAGLGIAAALYKRLKTGTGTVVSTSLYAGCLLFSPKAKGERVKARSVKVTAYGGGPFYSVFQCKDGEWLQLGCIHGGFVDLAAAAMNITHVMLDPRYGDGRTPVDEEARKELFEIVKDSISKKTSVEWQNIFTEVGVPFALVNTAEEALEHEQIIYNEMLYTCNDPLLGQMLQPGAPIKFSRTPSEIRGPREFKNTEAISFNLESDRRFNEVTNFCGRTNLPLEGVKVSDITNVIAGPVAGRLLADLGADVVKIEPPYGDISRPASGPYFHALNANKRSIAIDAKTESGRDALRRIVASSDVLIANLRPGATNRMGLSEELLQKSNPKLIETHITAFGWDGPFSKRPGVDPLAQAWTGLQLAQGGGNERPSFLPPIAPTDYAAGAMGALGTVVGLYVAEKYGYGQNIQTNLLNAGCFLTDGDFSMYDNKPARRLADKNQKGISDFHRLYETADGWLYISCERIKLANAFLEAVGLSGSYVLNLEFTTSNPAINSELGEEIQKIMKLRETDYWLNILQNKKIPHSPSVSCYDKLFFEDPQAINSGIIVKCDVDSDVSYSFSGNLVQFTEIEANEFRPTPLLGEHSLDILTESGFQPEKISELINEGVILVN